jgi:hypothetical protein
MNYELLQTVALNARGVPILLRKMGRVTAAGPSPIYTGFPIKLCTWTDPDFHNPTEKSGLTTSFIDHTVLEVYSNQPISLTACIP